MLNSKILYHLKIITINHECCCMPSETYGRNWATPIFRSFHRTASSTISIKHYAASKIFLLKSIIVQNVVIPNIIQMMLASYIPVSKFPCFSSFILSRSVVCRYIRANNSEIYVSQ